MNLQNSTKKMTFSSWKKAVGVWDVRAYRWAGLHLLLAVVSCDVEARVQPKQMLLFKGDF